MARRRRDGVGGLNVSRRGVDGDEVFLPPALLKARRKNPQHWANSAGGYIPATPPRVEPLPLPPGAVADLWSETFGIKGFLSLPRQAHLGEAPRASIVGQGPGPPPSASGAACPAAVAVAGCGGTMVPVDSLDAGSLGDASGPTARARGDVLVPTAADEPKEHELLDEEETAAKSRIWHEVNADLLRYWHARKELNQGKQHRHEQLARQRARQQEEDARLREHRVGRAQKRPRVVAPRRRLVTDTGALASDGALAPRAALRVVDDLEAEAKDDELGDFWAARGRAMATVVVRSDPPGRRQESEAEVRQRLTAKRLASEIEDLFA